MTAIIPKVPDVSKIFASRQQVTAALERSAERARVIAAQTGTKLVVVPPSEKTPSGTAPQVFKTSNFPQ